MCAQIIMSGTLRWQYYSRRNTSRGRFSVFDTWLSVEVRGPVDQVEAPEQNGEHDAGYAVDFTDAVEALLVLLRPRCHVALGNGGQWGVLGDVWCVAGHSHGICVVFLQSGGLLFL